MSKSVYTPGEPLADLNPMPVRDATGAAQPDGNVVGQVGTTLSKFVEGFSNFAGTAFDPLQWDTLRNSGGITVSVPAVVGGSAAVSVPATAGAELLVVGKIGATIPANLVAALSATVRSATTAVRIGYVRVDPTTGLPVAHASIAGDFDSRVNVSYASATATTVILETVSESSAVKQLTLNGQATTASAHEVALDVRNEDVALATATFDSTAARVAGGRLSSVVPDPLFVYRPFIWVVNTAASTASVWTFNRLASLDVQELQAEIGGGRGNAAPSQAIPVIGTVGVSSLPALPAGANAIGSVTLANALASATANGATPHKLVAAASTNATSVKASAGKVIGGQVANTSAAWKYLKFFNKASAPTVGTDVPVFIVSVPPNGIVELAAVFDQYGLSLSAGIAYAVTGAAASLDATALAANDVVLSLLYI